MMTDCKETFDELETRICELEKEIEEMEIVLLIHTHAIDKLIDVLLEIKKRRKKNDETNK